MGGSYSTVRAGRKVRRLASVLLLACFTVGCCAKDDRIEPNYPSNISGWSKYEQFGVKMCGSFVLQLNEATDNGKLQVKVLELIPPDLCAHSGSFQRQARVKFQFVRLEDQKLLCEDIFPERGGGSISGCQASVAELGIHAVQVRAINLREGWAYFVLPGCY
jgi:hypothetical protein